MRISPKAIGIDVVPIESLVTASPTWGTKRPSPTPKAMARKIHKVRKRSNVDSLRGLLIESAVHMRISLLFQKNSRKNRPVSSIEFRVLQHLHHFRLYLVPDLSDLLK